MCRTRFQLLYDWRRYQVLHCGSLILGHSVGTYAACVYKCVEFHLACAHVIGDGTELQVNCRILHKCI